MMRRAALLILIFIGVFVTLGMVINGSRTIMGTLDFSTATGILRPPFSDTIPGTCTKGDVFFDTNEDTNGSWMLCVATNTWKDTDDDGSAGGSVATDGIWDAKGDLAGGTGANTAAALTVGANDTILMAASGEATGLKWGNAATVKTALSLGNVENTALTTWTGNTAIVSTGTVTTGTWQSDGNFAAEVFTITTSAGDQTLAAAGACGLDSATDQFACNFGASGEITGEAVIPALQVVSVTWAPGPWFDADNLLFVMTVGDEAPNGITIVEWRLSCNLAAPSAELDIDLKRADAFTTIVDDTADCTGATLGCIMDALDTTSGVATEDAAANINGGAIVANGQVIYLEVQTDPATTTCVQAIFQMWYVVEED